MTFLSSAVMPAAADGADFDGLAMAMGSLLGCELRSATLAPAATIGGRSDRFLTPSQQNLTPG
jgi:hypothetical protein